MSWPGLALGAVSGIMYMFSDWHYGQTRELMTAKQVDKLSGTSELSATRSSSVCGKTTTART